MVGTPASISSAGLSQRLRRGEAYSLKKIAAKSPTGNATAIAIRVVRMVPLASTIMPKLGLANEAVHWVEVKKSSIDTSRKKFTVSKSKTNTIPQVVSTEASAHAARAAFLACSRHG